MSASVILGGSDTDAARIRDDYETHHRDDDAIRNCLDWTMGGGTWNAPWLWIAGSHSLIGGTRCPNSRGMTTAPTSPPTGVRIRRVGSSTAANSRHSLR
ncbi:hypothetical protein ABZU76_08515 [Amycolatopsis sp. NPDC005232]|uniref:hypothetical protein n=1 Tax=Amycolatopsis sp. NPDC005232 TaxID=3157027 RepID=UPI0033AF80F6